MTKEGKNESINLNQTFGEEMAGKERKRRWGGRKKKDEEEGWGYHITDQWK